MYRTGKLGYLKAGIPTGVLLTKGKRYGTDTRAIQSSRQDGTEASSAGPATARA